MTAFLLPTVVIVLALASIVALADSALRWVSAYRRLYPAAAPVAAPLPDMRRSHLRRTGAAPSGLAIKQPVSTRAVA